MEGRTYGRTNEGGLTNGGRGGGGVHDYHCFECTRLNTSGFLESTV